VVALSTAVTYAFDIGAELVFTTILPTAGEIAGIVENV
jgi:hypothetical protein